MRLIAPLIASMALLGAACSSASTSPESASSQASSSVSPSSQSTPGQAESSDWPYEFVATTVDGATLDTGDYAGTDLVLWFWAPW